MNAVGLRIYPWPPASASWLVMLLPLSIWLDVLEELEDDELPEVEVLSFWFCHWYSADV